MRYLQRPETKAEASIRIHFTKKKKVSHLRKRPRAHAVLGLPNVEVQKPLQQPDVGDGGGNEAVEAERRRARRKRGSSGGGVGFVVVISNSRFFLLPILPPLLYYRIQGELVEHTLEVESDLSAAFR